MALKLDDKKAIVAEVAEVAANAISAVAAEYRGMTVAELTELRANARNSGVYLRVVRNTLARRALQDTEFACLQDALVGPMILAFSKEEPSAAAKLLQKACDSYDKLSVKALSIGGKLLGSNELNTVASLPTYDQAVALLMSVMQAPVTKLVRTMAEPYAQVVRTVAAIHDKKAA